MADELPMVYPLYSTLFFCPTELSIISSWTKPTYADNMDQQSTLQRKVAVRIKPRDAGRSAMAFVVQRFTYHNAEQWRKEFDAGRFFLNDLRLTDAETVLQTGDRLLYCMPKVNEPPVIRSYDVVYEDDDLLVVDKPAGLPCHPAGRYFHHTLWSLLRERHGLEHPSLVNRIDRETSGIVLVAKSRQAARHCCRQFAERTVDKLYLLIVEGLFPAFGFHAGGILLPDSASLIRKKARFIPLRQGEDPAPQGRPCRTSFYLLEQRHDISLLAAVPHSGYCHQIRATVHGLGFPLVGDKLYGVDERFFLKFRQNQLSQDDHKRLRLPRQALHASLLRIFHPSDGRRLTFFAPTPSEFFSLAGRHTGTDSDGSPAAWCSRPHLSQILDNGSANPP